jgi:D-alanyl-D-alanine carboxypeptidase/D-alanyl-D-alanine-endopeptidase (penicillin-binding protein 4)
MVARGALQQTIAHHDIMSIGILSKRLRAPLARCLLCVASLLSGLPAHGRDAPLPPVVAKAIKESGIPASAVSIYVRSANSDDVLVAHNADTSRSPASTIKVLTTFIALDLLGPAYTWQTRAYATGPIKDRVLEGDLVLVGGGDPYMTSERWWSFVQSLRQLGIERIRGDVVIDNTLFAGLEGARDAFDNQPYRSYNVIPDALMVNFQTSRFTLIPDPGKSRPLINVDPMPSNLVIDNGVKVAAGRCRPNPGIAFDTAPTDAGALAIRGTLATDCGAYSITRAIMTAPTYAYGTFRTLWEQLGGKIDGKLKLAEKPAKATLLYTQPSLSMAEIIRLVNKYSNNIMARTLLLTIGAETLGAPATTAKGRNAVLSWLAAHDIKIPGLFIDNGSGLSRSERITAQGLGEVLGFAWRSQFMPEFAASLPLSATDGTLRNRYGTGEMQGRLRLKTGRIDDVSGLAGFINAASGKTYVMVIIVNHPGAHTGTAEPIQSALARWVFGQ